jgi:hypothetical protein
MEVTVLRVLFSSSDICADFVESKYLGNTLATKNQRTQNIWIMDAIRIA